MSTSVRPGAVLPAAGSAPGFPELKAVGRITLLESLACVKLVLWDESGRKLISFREERALG